MPDGRLSDTVCLVTGGGRGIGGAAARSLASAGATVVLSSRDRGSLDRVATEIAASGGRAHVLPWTLTGESAGELVAETVAEHGRLDVLVHAAGNQVRKPTLEFGLAEWDEVLDVHLRSAFTLAQAAIGHMAERGSGSIVFVGSMTSERLGHPSTVAYAAAKSGLLGLARTLAVEFASAGVRVNTVLPGFIRTDMAAEVTDTPQRKALTDRIPQGRYGDPAEIGSVIEFLASPAARYMTGEAVTVDGGWSVA